jgi:hypothetical protein
MPSWILVPCLDRLRDDFDGVAPSRDHASDGTIGDANHSSSSDHTPDEISDALRRKDADSRNEVHALDVDADLRVPGLSMEIVVQFLLARCRSGAERRLRYIIFNRRIWEASNGWRQVRYTGPNPHDKHAHFSSSYTTSLEASTASWHLEDIPVALTADDKKWISAEIAKQIKANADDIWGYDLGKAVGRDPYTARGLQYDTGIRVKAMANETVPLVADNVGALVAKQNQMEATLNEIKALVTKAVPQGK